MIVMQPRKDNSYGKMTITKRAITEASSPGAHQEWEVVGGRDFFQGDDNQRAAAHDEFAIDLANIVPGLGEVHHQHHHRHRHHHHHHHHLSAASSLCHGWNSLFRAVNLSFSRATRRLRLRWESKLLMVVDCQGGRGGEVELSFWKRTRCTFFKIFHPGGSQKRGVQLGGQWQDQLHQRGGIVFKCVVEWDAHQIDHSIQAIDYP